MTSDTSRISSRSIPPFGPSFCSVPLSCSRYSPKRHRSSSRSYSDSHAFMCPTRSWFLSSNSHLCCSTLTSCSFCSSYSRFVTWSHSTTTSFWIDLWRRRTPLTSIRASSSPSSSASFISRRWIRPSPYCSSSPSTCPLIRLFVYMNYIRKSLLIQHQRLYYGLMICYSLYIIYRMMKRSFMFFIFAIVLKAFLLIIVPLAGAFLDSKRVQIKGPFSTPFVFNYSFENYHILRMKIEEKLAKYVK